MKIDEAMHVAGRREEYDCLDHRLGVDNIDKIM